MAARLLVCRRERHGCSCDAVCAGLSGQRRSLRTDGSPRTAHRKRRYVARDLPHVSVEVGAARTVATPRRRSLGDRPALSGLWSRESRMRADRSRREVRPSHASSTRVARTTPRGNRARRLCGCPHALRRPGTRPADPARGSRPSAGRVGTHDDRSRRPLPPRGVAWAWWYR